MRATAEGLQVLLRPTVEISRAANSSYLPRSSTTFQRRRPIKSPSTNQEREPHYEREQRTKPRLQLLKEEEDEEEEVEEEEKTTILNN